MPKTSASCQESTSIGATTGTAQTEPGSSSERTTECIGTRRLRLEQRAEHEEERELGEDQDTREHEADRRALLVVGYDSMKFAARFIRAWLMIDVWEGIGVLPTVPNAPDGISIN